MQENKGVQYERLIKQTLKDTGLTLAEENTGDYNSHAPDVTLQHQGQAVNIEVKLDTAQMGETSFHYHKGTFVPIKADIEPTVIDIATTALEPLVNNFEQLLAFLRRFPPEDFHAENYEIPVRVTKPAWESAVAEGLLKPLNEKRRYTAEHICRHYNSKQVFYMQIAKKGLFYLGQNPLELPVPPLQGAIDLELRMKRGGSSWQKSVGEKVATAGLIVAGRRKFDTLSPYTLENPEHVRFLFGGT